MTIYLKSCPIVNCPEPTGQIYAPAGGGGRL